MKEASEIVRRLAGKLREVARRGAIHHGTTDLVLMADPSGSIAHYSRAELLVDWASEYPSVCEAVSEPARNHLKTVEAAFWLVLLLDEGTYVGAISAQHVGSFIASV